MAGPLPVRVQDGRLHVTLPTTAVAGLGTAGVREHFAAAGLDAELAVVADELASALRTVRSDLHETTFVAHPTPVGD